MLDSQPTVVFVHGAGHTAQVWDATRAAIGLPSIAVNLPARAGKPGDITTITVDEAADSIAHDIRAAVDGPMVLVAHSVSGTVAPTAAARIGGQVEHLVFVAGITVPAGQRPFEHFAQARAEEIRVYLDRLRQHHAGATLETMDTRTASSIDSLNFSSQPMQWHGVPETAQRTYIRCRRDQVQTRAMQDLFATSSGARQVVEIDTGHNPMLEAPELLAATLLSVLG